MLSKSDYKQKITKLAASERVASFESILSKVDSMTDQQRDEFIAGFVKEHGIASTLNLVKQTLANLSLNLRHAQIYEGLKSQPQSAEPMAEYVNKPSPSTFKQKLNDAGDWGYLLTVLLMVGTAGTSDLGGDWKDILKGFALTIGTGFLAWVAKKISSFMK